MAEQQTLHTQPGQQHPVAAPSASMEKPSDVQPMSMQQMNVAQPVQYVMQGTPMSIVAYPRPSSSPPPSHKTLVVITLIICLIINITSLAFGIPALILSILSHNASLENRWKSAKAYGRVALYLSIANMIYVICAALFSVGLYFGFLCWFYCNYNG